MQGHCPRYYNPDMHYASLLATLQTVLHGVPRLHQIFALSGLQRTWRGPVASQSSSKVKTHRVEHVRASETSLQTTARV